MQLLDTRPVWPIRIANRIRHEPQTILSYYLMGIFDQPYAWFFENSTEGHALWGELLCTGLKLERHYFLEPRKKQPIPGIAEGSILLFTYSPPRELTFECDMMNRSHSVYLRGK